MAAGAVGREPCGDRVRSVRWGEMAKTSNTTNTDPYATYESPLAARNASPEMLRLFSPRHKFGLWRRLWLELARCERELGLTRIGEQALREMEATLDDIDFAKAADWERRL